MGAAMHLVGRRADLATRLVLRVSTKCPLWADIRPIESKSLSVCFGRGPSVRRPAGFRVDLTSGMPLSAGSNQSKAGIATTDLVPTNWKCSEVAPEMLIPTTVLSRIGLRNHRYPTSDCK